MIFDVGASNFDLCGGITEKILRRQRLKMFFFLIKVSRPQLLGNEEFLACDCYKLLNILIIFQQAGRGRIRRKLSTRPARIDSVREIDV